MSACICTVRLSVLVPMASGGTEVNRFRLESAAPFEWFKQHADELAGTCLPGVAYNALNLELLSEF
jgi:hypothetical protein